MNFSATAAERCAIWTPTLKVSRTMNFHHLMRNDATFSANFFFSFLPEPNSLSAKYSRGDMASEFEINFRKKSRTKNFHPTRKLFHCSFVCLGDHFFINYKNKNLPLAL